MDYTIIRSDRKSIAIHITRNGNVEVRAPYFVSEKRIREFAESKADWVAKKLQSIPQLPPFTQKQLQEFAAQAKNILPQRAGYYAKILGVQFHRITVRSQRSRWGSCSQKGNLNFNCLLALAPPEILDYVVVHELCHLREMNHSPRFWALVESVLPDCRTCRQWLKDHGKELISRLP